MTKRVVAGAVALALLAGGAWAAESLKSGPQVGDGVASFECLNVTGPHAGPEPHCLVCQYGPRPVVMIFARRPSDPLTSLIKKVDAANKERGKTMGSFVVFLDKEEGLDKKLKSLAEKEKLEKTVLAVDNPDDSVADTIAKEAEVTVVLYVDHVVQVNHAYKKGEFKPEDADRIIKELPKILNAQKK
jgi:hypothetical protein